MTLGDKLADVKLEALGDTLAEALVVTLLYTLLEREV